MALNLTDGQRTTLFTFLAVAAAILPLIPLTGLKSLRGQSFLRYMKARNVKPKTRLSKFIDRGRVL